MAFNHFLKPPKPAQLKNPGVQHYYFSLQVSLKTIRITHNLKVSLNLNKIV
jgi:hypothetical protein